ncbi:MAG: glycoside hydrolase family 125 protein [Eubacteriales bacterium]|nr:glycoside hydrolase family 125 protein [Eubacteriales bacterium]
MNLPKAIIDRTNEYYKKILPKNEKLAKLYKNCYPNTLETAVVPKEDGTYFVLTGDIPAMWLRDSTAQVSHYIPVAAYDDEVKHIIKGVVRRQFKYIQIDSYANAFNEEANGRGMEEDLPKNLPWVWERKYEIDSLCYPFRLAYLYWKATGDDSIIDEQFMACANITVRQWTLEQNHENSLYRFFRKTNRTHDTIHNDGFGAPVAYTGMTWSGFRPSDDACKYGYLIPSNMFAVVVLGYIIEMVSAVFGDDNTLIFECTKLRDTIDKGIKEFASVEHEKYGKIYACETDGMGNYTLMDDANVPSLLSIPYIGYADTTDELYKSTRRFLLSNDNPYYFDGKYAKGIGSPHTPKNYIWHIALSMQGLTSDSADEIREILDMICRTDADTGFMHEGFDAEDPTKFSRPWFTWSNSLFAELVEKAVDNGVI